MSKIFPRLSRVFVLVFVFLPGLVQPYCKAAVWIDVTENYIKNAGFDNNNGDSWEGTAWGFANPMYNAEHYNKTYDTYQDLTGLTAGKYRLSMQGYYRAGNSSTDWEHFNYDGDTYRYAYLYGTSSTGDYSVQLPYASSAAQDGSLGGATSQVGDWWSGQTKYIPNNMEAAYYWFQNGYYNNSVEVEVGSDGRLRIGIRKTTTISEDWTCVDNFKLEYYGEEIKVQSITLDATQLKMVVDEEYVFTPTILPTTATNKKLDWWSSNTSVVMVDENGVVNALKEGSATIRVTALDGSGTYANCGITVTANTPSSDNIMINEIQASNVDMFMDPSFNYGTWIELYNPTTTPVSLSGLYISDDAENLKKYRFTKDHGTVPAKGYKVIWFDHYGKFTSLTQVNFKLDYEGGDIIISDGTNIIDQKTYPGAKSRCSYARITDGGVSWKNTADPTPGETNTTSTFCNSQLDAPEVSVDGKMFTSAFDVKVTIPEGTTLRYTTDGTTPTLTNGQTSQSGSFSVSSTTVFRFRLFRDGYLPSRVVTRSYIKQDRQYVFPIISVVTDPDNIYDTNYGVFMQGPNGRPGNGQTSKCNWNMDWDRPVNMEYMLKGGQPTSWQDANPSTDQYVAVHNQETDFSMCGGWSRAWTPHSFKIKAEKTYNGENFLSYPFFPNKPYIKNKTLQIRNGGNDTNCRIKDGALQEIMRTSGLYIDGQSWQPVHVFINGSYYNVLNMREPNNKHFAYANYGIDTDYMDQFEMSPDSGYVQMTGTKTKFLEWYELSKICSNDAAYKQICEMVDIDEYINYMAAEFYLGGTDWPQNNVKGFRDQNDGKFHFVVFDLDGTFATTSPFTTFAAKKNYTFDTLHGTGIEGQRISSEIQFVTIFINMLNNAEFRKRFTDAFCVVSGSVFEPTRCKDIITKTSSYLGQNNFVYPSSTANSLISNLSSTRVSNLTNALKNYSPMKITSARKQLNLTNNCSAARLYLNDMVIPTGELKGYVFPPATLRAETPAGYSFVGWAKNSTSQQTLFPSETLWYYYDKGSLDGKDWKSINYSTSGWSTGTAPLGYGKSNLNTTISYGSNSSQKYPTYYFRKTFTLSEEPSSSTTFTLDYIIDDGFVIYVNGVEAGRYNMPSGTPSYSTYASTYAPNNPDTGTMTLDPDLFQKGPNIIAVEVHNNSANSSDIMWSASLQMTGISTDNLEYVSQNAEYTLPTTGTDDLVAVFQSLSAEERADMAMNPIVVNEISAANEIYLNDQMKKKDWIEVYNTTDKEIDIAGMYISDNPNKPQKYQIPYYSQLTDANGLPISTIVPAHGHVAIWCDKMEPLSQLHTTFKLADEGGVVLISPADMSWTDVMYYPEHSAYQSLGRYPDGANRFYVMSKTTISATNILCTGDEEYIPVLLGDANNDGTVDVADITAIAAYILDSESMTEFNSENADANQDGSIDVADITATAAIILQNSKKDMWDEWEMENFQYDVE